MDLSWLNRSSRGLRTFLKVLLEEEIVANHLFPTTCRSIYTRMQYLAAYFLFHLCRCQTMFTSVEWLFCWEMGCGCIQ